VPALLVRGAQLSVVGRLDAPHVVAIQTQLLGWAAKRAGAAAAAGNKPTRNSALLFFRVLQPLLAPVDARDALKMCVFSLLSFFVYCVGPKLMVYTRMQQGAHGTGTRTGEA
jgi:hypothetical protein